MDDLTIEIVSGMSKKSNVRLVSPTEIKITRADRTGRTQAFFGSASELIKKLMENNNEIQC